MRSYIIDAADGSKFVILVSEESREVKMKFEKTSQDNWTCTLSDEFMCDLSKILEDVEDRT
jgi:hypothetical protein